MTPFQRFIRSAIVGTAVILFAVAVLAMLYFSSAQTVAPYTHH